MDKALIYDLLGDKEGFNELDNENKKTIAEYADFLVESVKHLISESNEELKQRDVDNKETYNNLRKEYQEFIKETNRDSKSSTKRYNDLVYQKNAENHQNKMLIIQKDIIIDKLKAKLLGIDIIEEEKSSSEVIEKIEDFAKELKKEGSTVDHTQDVSKKNLKYFISFNLKNNNFNVEQLTEIFYSLIMAYEFKAY
jgi:hypothetical protein